MGPLSRRDRADSGWLLPWNVFPPLGRPVESSSVWYTGESNGDGDGDGDEDGESSRRSTTTKNRGESRDLV